VSNTNDAPFIKIFFYGCTECPYSNTHVKFELRSFNRYRFVAISI